MGLTLPKRQPKFKVRKITRNSVVYGHYVWQIKFAAPKLYTPRGQMFTVTKPWEAVDDYLTVRKWCEESFGSSIEYPLFYFEEAADSEHFNPAWCFQCELPARKYCIYLNDAAMSLFNLRWQ